MNDSEEITKSIDRECLWWYVQCIESGKPKPTSKDIDWNHHSPELRERLRRYRK